MSTDRSRRAPTGPGKRPRLRIAAPLYWVMLLAGTGVLILAMLEGVARLEGSYARHREAVAMQREWRHTKARGVEYPASPGDRDKEVVIYCLGDSFTFGHLLNLDQTWPKRLADRLNGADWGRGRKVVAYNLGQSGTGLEQQREILEKALAVGRPDLIVHQTFINDFFSNDFAEMDGIPLWDGKWNQAKIKTDFHFLYYFYRLVNTYPPLESTFSDYIKNFSDKDLPHWKVVGKAYAALVEEARSRDVPMVSFLAPAMFWKHGSYPFEALHDAIGFHLAGTNPLYFDMLPDLERQMPSALDHWVNKDIPDAHPDAATHDLYAEILVSRLQTMGLQLDGTR